MIILYVLINPASTIMLEILVTEKKSHVFMSRSTERTSSYLICSKKRPFIRFMMPEHIPTCFNIQKNKIK